MTNILLNNMCSAYAVYIPGQMHAPAVRILSEDIEYPRKLSNAVASVAGAGAVEASAAMAAEALAAEALIPRSHPLLIPRCGSRSHPLLGHVRLCRMAYLHSSHIT